MSTGRLLLVVIALGAGYYLYRHSGSFAGQTPDASSSAPLDRARRAAQQVDRRSAETDAAGREAESPAGTVTENMTPDQVRALLGPPTEVQTGASESGATRETWIYRHVGKTVIFENGIAISVR